MPFRRTPATPEISLNGNTGNPSYSQKLPNATAERTRRIRTSQANRFETEVDVTNVRPTPSQPGEAPLIAGSELQNSQVGDVIDVGSVGLDTYRVGNGEIQARTLGEAEADEPAAISVQTRDGDEVLSAFSRFFLQSVSEQEQEKYQVVETFTAYYTFFFGKRPPVYTFSGVLLNDQRHTWMNDFRFVYENFLRGTAAADLGAHTIITYDKRKVSGFVLSLRIQQDAMLDKGVPFSIDVLVVDHEPLTYSTDFNSFIQEQQRRLAELRAKAQADIRALTVGVDSTQSILGNLVLNGRRPPGSIKNSGASVGGKPSSQITTKTDKARAATLPSQKITPGSYANIGNAGDSGSTGANQDFVDTIESVRST